jgi:hypothetical protein
MGDLVTAMSGVHRREEDGGTTRAIWCIAGAPPLLSRELVFRAVGQGGTATSMVVHHP